jgi:hypothetical protein
MLLAQYLAMFKEKPLCAFFYFIKILQAVATIINTIK